MYMMLIDTSRCISCRACQVACKHWHALPPETNNEPRTGFTGTTFTLVKETEAELNRKLKVNGVEVVQPKLMRLFFKDQCRHCVGAKCRLACRDAWRTLGHTEKEDEMKDGAIVREKTGAVVIDKTKCDPATCVINSTWGNKYPCVERCPYHAPRIDPVINKMRKCDFCYDRIAEIKEGSPRTTACADACPSGAIFFGEVNKVLAEAKARLAKVKTRYPGAKMGGYVNSTRVRWILVGDPALYGLPRNIGGK